MKNYHIQRPGEENELGEVTVTVRNQLKRGWHEQYRLTPDDSLKLRNHSPTGFNFGYGGSGPAQLALAILLDFTDEQTALANYQRFKGKFIAGMKHPGGEIEGDEIAAWLAETKMADWKLYGKR
jgi:hypothetical protein